MLDSLVAVDAP